MKTLTTEEFKEMKQGNQDLLIINTLSNENFRKTKIPDSINIPVDSVDFPEKVEKTAGSKDKPIVVYCASKECNASPRAAQKLEEAGFSNVMDFEGGSKAWQESGENLTAVV